MKRLTYRDAEKRARWRKELLEDDTGAAGELIRNTVADIEDILGDDYDLDRLRELVEADHDGRCFITGRPYPVTGKAADGKITGWVKDGFYCPICQKIHERAIKKTVYLSREAALKGEQDG